LQAPWILFEAGALSKALQAAAVCPYLLDVEFKELTGPLAQFQAKKADRRQTFELLQAINTKASSAVEDSHLSELFDVLWPKLEQAVRNIPAMPTQAVHMPTQGDVIEELVGVVRGLDHRFSRLEMSLLGEMRSELPTIRAESGLTQLHARVEQAERDAILSALVKAGGNKARAARLLGITRGSLHVKLKRLGLLEPGQPISQ
jgi:transcriptional regulator with PAS, ATPase and Fis domain